MVWTSNVSLTSSLLSSSAGQPRFRGRPGSDQHRHRGPRVDRLGCSEGAFVLVQSQCLDLPPHPPLTLPLPRVAELGDLLPDRTDPDAPFQPGKKHAYTRTGTAAVVNFYISFSPLRRSCRQTQSWCSLTETASPKPPTWPT